MIVAISIQCTYAQEVTESNETVIVNGQISEDRQDLSENDVKIITPIDIQYTKITDYPHGYSVNFPNHMNVDVHLSPIRTIIFDKTTQIEVYYDDLSNTQANASDYIYYSNSFLNNKVDHTKIYEKNIVHNNKKIHILKWKRRKLSKIPNDKNYYLCAEIIKNKKEVYTIFFKSSMELDDNQCMSILKSFECIEKKGTTYISLNENYPIKKHNQWNEETQQFFNDYFVDSKQLTWGIFDPLAPNYFDYFLPLEKRLDFKFPFLLVYHILPSSDTLEDVRESLEIAYEDNRYVELTLQTSKITEEEGNIVYDILDGEYDDYFNEYAQMIKAFNHPVMFRLNNEMNGDWCDYSSFHTSKDTSIYKAFYQYVYTVFKENGVENVIWIWNPHDRSFPNFKWNHSLMYYPKDEMVDIIGLTGYNTGTYYPSESWRGFNEIYDSLYGEYNDYFDKPFMLTEFSSSCYGGDKNEWIKEMFDNITKYEKIKAAIWWNGCDYDSNGIPARIYRLDQTNDMINIFKERLHKFK